MSKLDVLQSKILNLLICENFFINFSIVFEKLKSQLFNLHLSNYYTFYHLL